MDTRARTVRFLILLGFVLGLVGLAIRSNDLGNSLHARETVSAVAGRMPPPDPKAENDTTKDLSH